MLTDRWRSRDVHKEDQVIQECSLLAGQSSGGGAVVVVGVVIGR